QGTKINSWKEEVISDTYLVIQEFRFYFNCQNCKAEMIMKTDPGNIDYVVEEGGIRRFDPWRNNQDDKEKLKRYLEDDAMRLLEDRRLD
ncbi:YJU2 splicing factor-like protein, partial [Bienertia sinuspersici]